MQHYTYWLKDQFDNNYIGVRSHSNPNSDTYKGSSKYLRHLEDNGSIFVKSIIACWSSRDDANLHEQILHECFDVETNPRFVNKQNNTGQNITIDIARKGGKASKPSLKSKIAGGKAQGKREVDNGHLAAIRPSNPSHPKHKEHQKNASARASRKVYALEDPSVRSSWNQKKATEKRLGKQFTWIDL
jgi:hypothetical protein